MKKNGFSLIELIVVITIIAVVTAVGVVSFGGANKKSRDSKRMADLERYRIALEMYRQTNGIYPDPATWTTDLGTAGLISSPFTDPKTGYTYVYGSLTDYTYGLWACVEGVGASNSPASGANCDGQQCNCASGGTCLGGFGCNYRIQNP